MALGDERVKRIVSRFDDGERPYKGQLATWTRDDGHNRYQLPTPGFWSIKVTLIYERDKKSYFRVTADETRPMSWEDTRDITYGFDRNCGTSEEELVSLLKWYGDNTYLG